MQILYKNTTLNCEIDYQTGKMIENVIKNSRIDFVKGRPIIHNILKGNNQ